MNVRILFILILSTVLAGAADAQSFQRRYTGYTLSIAGGPRNNPDASSLAVISAKLDSLTREQRDRRFGLLYRSSGQMTALEFLDGTTGSVLRSISAEQLLGRTSAEWSAIAAETRSGDSMHVAAFRTTLQGRPVTVRRILEIAKDMSMPRGSAFVVRWTVGAPQEMQLRVRFTGLAEGVVTAGGNTLRIAPGREFTGFRPVVVVEAPRGSTLELQGSDDDPVRRVVVEGPVVSIPAGEAAEILSLRAIGTTVATGTHPVRQAATLTEYLTGGVPAPRMVTETSMDKDVTRSGDTLTVSIMFHNIGTAPATGVALSNPIAAGLRYLDGSATGDGAEIAFERTEPEPPQRPTVRGISWTFTSDIRPGEERWVSFKAIVQ